jgi:hypothetical protein
MDNPFYDLMPYEGNEEEEWYRCYEIGLRLVEVYEPIITKIFTWYADFIGFEEYVQFGKHNFDLFSTPHYNGYLGTWELNDADDIKNQGLIPKTPEWGWLRISVFFNRYKDTRPISGNWHFSLDMSPPETHKYEFRRIPEGDGEYVGDTYENLIENTEAIESDIVNSIKSVYMKLT